MYLHTVFSQVSLRIGIVTLYTDNCTGSRSRQMAHPMVLNYKIRVYCRVGRWLRLCARGWAGGCGAGISQLGVRTPKKRHVYVAVRLPLSEPSSHLPEDHTTPLQPWARICSLQPHLDSTIPHSSPPNPQITSPVSRRTRPCIGHVSLTPE